MSIYNMPPNMIIIRKPKANKEHICSICKDPILPGEKYITAAAMSPGHGFRVVKGCRKHYTFTILDACRNAFPENIRQYFRVSKHNSYKIKTFN